MTNAAVAGQPDGTFRRFFGMAGLNLARLPGSSRSHAIVPPMLRQPCGMGFGDLARCTICLDRRRPGREQRGAQAADGPIGRQLYFIVEFWSERFDFGSGRISCQHSRRCA
jgi:hypothetical protein